MTLKQLVPLFLILSVLYLASLSFGELPFSWLLKILPILTLIAFVELHPPFAAKWLIRTALTFSLFGDVLLELNFFVPGLGMFLIAQLAYAIFFARLWRGFQQRILLTIGLLAYLLSMVAILMPHLGDMRLPVIAYMIAISFMGFLALHSQLNVWPAVVGAFTFIASDSIIAFDRFYHPLVWAPYGVMVTYYLAQLLLILGIMKTPEHANHQR